MWCVLLWNTEKKSSLTFAWFTCILCMLSFSLCYEYYKGELIMQLWVIQESGQEAQSLFSPKQAESFMGWGSCSSAQLWRAHSSSSFPLHSWVQQPPVWFHRGSSLSSHTRHLTRQNQPPDGEGATAPWGETNSKCERNIVKCYCCLVIFLPEKKLCLFHVSIVSFWGFLKFFAGLFNCLLFTTLLILPPPAVSWQTN